MFTVLTRAPLRTPHPTFILQRSPLGSGSPGPGPPSLGSPGREWGGSLCGQLPAHCWFSDWRFGFNLILDFLVLGAFLPPTVPPASKWGFSRAFPVGCRRGWGGGGDRCTPCPCNPETSRHPSLLSEAKVLGSGLSSGSAGRGCPEPGPWPVPPGLPVGRVWPRSKFTSFTVRRFPPTPHLPRAVGEGRPESGPG